jgi:hypothetical protein
VFAERQAIQPAVLPGIIGMADVAVQETARS